MYFDLIDPGLNPFWMWWAVGVSAVGLIVFIASIYTWVADNDGEMARIGSGVGVLIAASGWLIFGVGVAVPLWGNELHGAFVTGIESAGFTDVSLDGEQFTANQDGEFFRGVIVEVSHDRYQILELTEADR